MPEPANCSAALLLHTVHADAAAPVAAPLTGHPRIMTASATRVRETPVPKPAGVRSTSYARPHRRAFRTSERAGVVGNHDDGLTRGIDRVAQQLKDLPRCAFAGWSRSG